MKAYKLLQETFRRLNQSTVEWHKSARFPKSIETANAILHRNLPVEAATLTYMAYCLNLPHNSIISILEEYGRENPKKALESRILCRLIKPLEMSSEEQDLLETVRRLPPEKQSLVISMVRGLL